MVVREGVLLVARRAEEVVAGAFRRLERLRETSGDEFERDQIAAAAAPVKHHVEIRVVVGAVVGEVRLLLDGVEVFVQTESRRQCGIDRRYVARRRLILGDVARLGSGHPVREARPAHAVGAEHRRVGSYAALQQRPGGVGGEVPPVEHHRRDEGLFAREAHDLVADHVVFPGEILVGGVDVGAVRELRERVDRELEPVGVVDELPLPEIGHVLHLAAEVVVAEEAVQRELDPVFFMDLLQSVQIEVVEGAFRTLLHEVGPEEAVVVDVEVAAAEGSFIPHHLDRLGELPERGHGPGGNGVDLSRQRHVREETPSVAKRGGVVDEDVRRDVADALDPDGKSVFILDAVVVVEDRALTEIGDFKHFRTSVVVRIRFIIWVPVCLLAVLRHKS